MDEIGRVCVFVSVSVCVCVCVCVCVSGREKVCERQRDTDGWIRRWGDRIK